MCEYTNRRNDSENWECPCPYRDRCERFSRCGCGNSRENVYTDGRYGCGDGRSARNRSNNRCGICSLFRRCFNR